MFLWFSHFSEQITPPACPLGPPPQFATLLKKTFKWKWCKLLFYYGTVVILLFFWTDNDLVCAPHPLGRMSAFFRCHNYSHTFVHNSKTTRSIFVKFGEIATNNRTHKFKINTIMKNCYFWSSDPLREYDRDHLSKMCFFYVSFS